MDREKAPWTSGSGELWGHRRPQILPPPLHPTRISDGPRKGVSPRLAPALPAPTPKGSSLPRGGLRAPRLCLVLPGGRPGSGTRPCTSRLPHDVRGHPRASLAQEVPQKLIARPCYPEDGRAQSCLVVTGHAPHLVPGASAGGCRVTGTPSSGEAPIEGHPPTLPAPYFDPGPGGQLCVLTESLFLCKTGRDTPRETVLRNT